jgi:uncharacterized protein YrrD
MELQLETPVFSADGTDMGKVHRVIFDPQKAEVRSIVVKKGVFFARDVAIPIEDVRAATTSRVELSLTHEQADKFPEFVEADYTWPDANWMAPYGWGMGDVMWPMGVAGGYDGYPLDPGARTAEMPDEASRRLQKQDLENAVVGEGSEVMAKGGEKLGEVHNMVIDPTSHKPSSVVIRSGFIFTEDVEVPGDWVASYDDRVVTLNVDKPTVEHRLDSQKNDKGTLSATRAKARQA